VGEVHDERMFTVITAEMAMFLFCVITVMACHWVSSPNPRGIRERPQQIPLSL
jgi:hypothetical protein